MTNDNCYPIAPEAVRENAQTMRALIKEFIGARLSIPEFKTIEEARAFGLAHKNDDAIIHELFKLACQYKQLVLVFGMNNKFERQLDNYLYYKASWEVARGIDGARLADAEIKTESPFLSNRSISYGLIFLASVWSIRCCSTPPKPEESYTTVVEKDETGEYDSAREYTIQGHRFIFFPRNSKVYIYDRGYKRPLTLSERELFHAKVNTGGARLAFADHITNVVAVGVGNGLNLPYLKEFLEKKGFKNIVLEAIDDGWWIEDPMLPKPDKDLREEIVKTAEGVLIGRLESDEYRIRYVDLFDAFPKEMFMKFDIAFLTPNKSDMNISYIQESLKLLKEYGILILRLRSGQEFNRVDLVHFCEDNELNLSIYDESIFPNPDAEFQDLMIVLRRANFTEKGSRSMNLELFRRLIGARMARVSA